MFNYNGLNEMQVKENRIKYGSNEIISQRKNSFFKLVLDSLNDPIIKILLIALGIKVLLLFKDSDIYETVGIVLSILVASLISSVSEYGSEKAFEKLASENSKIKCRVIRSGKKCEINIDEVVMGDVVFLSAGDKIPADGIIIKDSVYVDESLLTGEAKEKNKIIYDKVYRGSIVTEKEALMEVKVIGNETFYGGIAKSIQEASPESPLKNRLRGLAKTISKIGYLCAFIVMFSYLFKVIVINNNFEISSIISTVSNYEIMIPYLLYALTLAVTIIVVSVPEGLPMMITLVLSSNMNRMLKNNVLVRKLVGIETAGSVNILFSDKTGTITKGQLEVVGFVNAFGDVFKKVNDIKNDKFKELLELSLIYNNNSSFESGNIIGGNSTDKSILKFVGDVKKYEYKVVNKVLFDSKIKYSSVTLDYENNLTFIKGAYEKFSDKVLYMYDKNGLKIKIDKDRINKLVKSYMENGIRIIAVLTGTEKIEQLSLLGFVLIKDEVRTEALKGIELVRKAGINVVMITGDATDTALNIARETSLISSDSDIILTSEELNKMSDEEVKKILPKLKVVARSLPQDKKRLVVLSQELGLVVGMTGDGVNDAPALKKADVGFAMGSGTEVAKEVSDIVILDDNFMSIVKSILFGRTIFKSIRKFIIFQLTVNLCAVMLSIIGPFIGVLAPVTVIQMLWINMVMDTLAGIAFAYEPPLKEYMEELPKKRNEAIMNKYMINQIVVTGVFCTIICLLFLKSTFIHEFFRIDNNDKYVMTAFFGLFIFLAIFNSFNARTHRLNVLANLIKNKAFIIVISFICIVQLILIYYGGEVFRTTGLTLLEFEIMLIMAFSVIPFDIFRKIVLKKKGSLKGV